jgi:transcriptional regulator with GAF, ATPase, and Fis domain
LAILAAARKSWMAAAAGLPSAGMQATDVADRQLKELLLSMTAVHACEPLIAKVTKGLAAQADVALARIWLVRPGDICPACPRRADCPGHVPCLHLVSSAGTARDPKSNWDRLDGAFRRFPIGVRKVGRVVTEGPIRIRDVAVDDAWIARSEWAASEGIRGFGGVPLRYGDETLGVLGVFTRAPFEVESLEWLTLIGDHAAAAIANARAFEEIERLKQQLELENAYLRQEVADVATFGDIVGSSAALSQMLEAIETVAPTDVNVLVTGESGTGKELVARAIHEHSDRSERTLVKVNCASVPRELFESEFFGHVKGAFTGAVKDRAGRFPLADGGTLFLDEVGEIPLEMQSKLLRVLQEGEYERIGDERTQHVDVRIVAATNRDLMVEVKEGRFREDLYYRLNVFPIEVAPLRERRQDIPALARHFIAKAAPKLKRPVLPLHEEASRRLSRYDWPGNIRELQNVIERALILSKDGPLRIDLPGAPDVPLANVEVDDATGAVLTDAEMKQHERDNLVRALERCDWQIYGEGGAAELLGVKPSTLASRMKKHAIVKG